MRWAVIAALATAWARGAGAAPGEVRYRVDVASAAARHEALVAMTVQDAPSPLELSMPVWTPGAYERRDWGRNVTAGAAKDGTGKALTVRRAGPGEVRVEGHAAGAEVTLEYRVFADQLGDDSSQIDLHHAYLNGTSIFLKVRGREGRVHRVALAAGAGAKVASALEEDKNGMFTDSYEALVDAPIEAGRFTEGTASAGGVSYRVVIDAADRAEAVPAKLLADVAAIARAEAELVGAPPYAKYLVLIHLADGPGRVAALEHRASTSIVVPRRALADEERYRELLYVVAHELFHAWNARRLVPVELHPIDFDRPAPSRALWITEGLTEYYAHRAMRGAGVWTAEKYLEQVADELSRVREDRLVERFTLEEEAELSWHAPDVAAGDPDAFYARGHAVALGIDLAVRARTGGARSLDDVVRLLLERAAKVGGALPVDTEVLARAAAEVAGDAAVGEKVREWARRVGAPGIGGELETVGLELVAREETARAALGISVEADRGALRIVAVAPEGAAARAGLRAGDRVVAVDGAAPPARWPGGAPATSVGVAVLVEVVRAARHIAIPVAPEERREVACRLVERGKGAAGAKAAREKWISGRRIGGR